MSAFKLKNTVWAIAAVLSVAAGSASAFTESFTDTTTRAQSIFINDFNSGTTFSGSPQVGKYVVTSAGGGPGITDVYCIDPRTSNSAGNYTEISLYSFLNTVNVGTAKTGYQEQMAASGYVGPPLLTYTAQAPTTVLNNLVNLYSHAYADSLTSKDKATAFGYVVWEIMGDSINGSSRTSGALQSKGTNQSNPDTVDAQIDAYLAGLSGGSWGGLTTVNTYTYSVLYNSANSPTNHVGQNFLRVVGNPGGNQGTGNIPEPGTIALAGLALLGTFRASRRKAVVA